MSYPSNNKGLYSGPQIDPVMARMALKIEQANIKGTNKDLATGCCILANRIDRCVSEYDETGDGVNLIDISEHTANLYFTMQALCIRYGIDLERALRIKVEGFCERQDYPKTRDVSIDIES